MPKVIAILVKHESANEFFKNNITDYPQDRSGYAENISAYNFMKDEIFIKVNSEIIQDATHVDIELIDESRYSKKRLVNKYKYQIVKYDDISCKLKLIDFKIELI